MDLLNFGGRDWIILTVIGAAVYLCVSLLRLYRIRHPMSTPGRFDHMPVHGAVMSNRPPDTPASPDILAIERRLQATEARQAAPTFDDQLFRSRVEADLQQLQGEVASLREALTRIQTMHRVSPQYNEAMLLAQHGLDANEIADRCAISRGEADLVVALSRGSQ